MHDTTYASPTPHDLPTTRSAPIVAITIDLHDGDVPADITFAASWLASSGIPATFFIPSGMLQDARYAERLRELPAAGHETASHSHYHDTTESDALIVGTREELRFLETSWRIHADFYGTPPVSFRAPGWCALAPTALDELQRLQYVVDSSATPQRLSVLGSTPFRGAWALCPRRPHYIRPGLLEVPTSTVGIPAGSPAFLILRKRMSFAFLRLLMLEAALLGDRVLVVQFHADDFNPRSVQSAPCAPHVRFEDFLLRRQGGFGFKHHLKDTDRMRVAATTQDIVRSMMGYRCRTLIDIARGLPGACASATAFTLTATRSGTA